MVPGILADNDVAGYFKILHNHFESDTWREIWHALHCPVYTFHQLGLPLESSDRLLWHECQRRQAVLVTGNRNDDGPDSLAAVIRDSNTPECLPVVTLADAKRIGLEKSYATRVAERLLEYLIAIEEVRGVGRLYVP